MVPTMFSCRLSRNSSQNLYHNLPRIAAQTLCLLVLSTFSLKLEAHWTYTKPTVLEFLASWRGEIEQDTFLDEREQDLRLQLVDRLSFQVDSKYFEQDFKGFLINMATEMALTDELATNRVSGSQAETFKNLKISLQEILEPSENILSFVRSFVEFTGLKNPKSIDTFANSRSYTNGAQTEQAEPLSLDEAARFALTEFPEAFANESTHATRPLQLLEFNHDLLKELELERSAVLHKYKLLY